MKVRDVMTAKVITPNPDTPFSELVDRLLRYGPIWPDRACTRSPRRFCSSSQLGCENQLVVVRGATHLFEEPGTLEAAAEVTLDWFTDHLAPTPHLAS
jgi:hypothetical protein